MPIPAGADTWNISSPGLPYPLSEDFSYKLGNNGVVLNTDSTTVPFVDVEQISGLDNAPYRTTERQHEGTDGSFMDAEFEKGRSIIIDGTVYGEASQVEPYLDALKANFAPSRTLMPFYFKHIGVEERYMRVKPLGCKYDIGTIRRVGRGEVQFSMFAEDPRIYSSATNQIHIHQEPVLNTGRSYNKSYNYSYGPPITSSGQNLLVGGNRPTPALIYISGPSSYPRIINDTLGITMEFDLILGTGENLTIDAQYHTVRLNGVANRRSSLLEPNWFSLMPGINYIRYRSQTDGASIMTVQWNNAWR